ncbi:unnamed protein product [Calypogeia fissa]
MRNNISTCCFTGVPDGECPSELVFESDFNQSENPEKEWWELRTTFNFDPSHGKVETKHVVDTNARTFSTTLSYRDCPAEENLHQETQKESSKLRHTVNVECISRNLESKRPQGSGPTSSAASRLPEEVVERILAMIPFPYLLKVRSLSKSWYRKFPHRALEASTPAGGSRMDQKRHPSKKSDRDRDWSSSNSFLSIVSSVSAKWSVYCPVILGNEGLIGYDPVHKTWQGLFTNLQQLLGTNVEPWLINACGPLISGVSQSPNSQYHVFVTNVLTRRWRKLPPHPSTRVPSLLNVLFDDSDGYKVFLVTEDPYEGPHDDCTGHDSNGHAQRRVSAQVFDSVKGTWTTSQSEVPSATSFAWRSCSVMFDGNIYCLSGDDRNPIDHPLQVWVYNLQEGSWTEIGHPFGQLVNMCSGTSVLLDLTRFGLFVCGSKIMVALALDPKQPYDDRVGSDTLVIYELDPETRDITFKSSGPPTTVLANSEHIASDGENIYFCTLDLLICYPIVVYNVKSGQWSCVAPDFRTSGSLTNKRWADFAFQPGLSPFMVP